MKVFKGILQVMKENKIMNIYQHEGNTESDREVPISKTV
jgi:hypothetical protein